MRKKTQTGLNLLIGGEVNSKMMMQMMVQTWKGKKTAVANTATVATMNKLSKMY